MPELTKRMAQVLRAMYRLREGRSYPPTHNEIARECGFSEGGRRHGSGASGRGGWSGHMAPANRIIFPLIALEGHGLVHYTRRRDGLSGTAYRLTPAGVEWVEENGVEDAP